MAQLYQFKSYSKLKFKKHANFCVQIYPIFAGSVTFTDNDYIPASRLVACPIFCKRTYNALAADNTLNIFVVGLVVKKEDLHKGDFYIIHLKFTLYYRTSLQLGYTSVQCLIATILFISVIITYLGYCTTIVRAELLLI